MSGREGFALARGLAPVEFFLDADEGGVLAEGETPGFDEVLGDFGDALFAFMDCEVRPV